MTLLNWLRTRPTTPARKPARRTRLAVEPLEGRDVPAALSVSDVTVREGPTATGVLDPGGPAALGLNQTRGLAFDTNPADAHFGDLFVVGKLSNSVARFDWATQTYQPFVTSGSGGLTQPSSIAIGPDGNVYVSSMDPQNNSAQAIFRYDGATGTPLPAPGRSGAVFVGDDPGTPNLDESGGLATAGWGNGITFGADGNLYACSAKPTTHQVLRFQGPNGPSPGAFLDVFVTITNMSNGPNAIAFGPDGSLYANGGGLTADKIDRFDGITGAPVGDGVFVAAQRGGLSGSRQFRFDPLGQYLYVVTINAGQVLRFQGPNNSTPGAFVDTYITQGQSGLTYPIGLALDPAGNLYVGERDANRITRFAPSTQAAFTVSLDAASAGPVSVSYATANGTAVAGPDYTQASGTLTFAPGVTSQTVNVPITTTLTGGPTKAFTLNLSAASGATVADGQGVGSVLNRVTKFFVVDAAAVKTYQYGSGGTSEEVTALNTSSNTAPRGAATTAAGTTVWVADANNNIFVYTSHGIQLGSWAASGLPYGASVEGVATNGTDIWVVVNTTSKDKVFKYAGAASRLSGYQNPAGSFRLAAGDTTPKDIVTDGSSFWVVDANQTVYEYTLAGGSLGSWKIDPANAHPTGITINPASVSDIWVVDNVTLKVYQYAAAAGRTSGSQAAATTFALNPGDANPQGIADPPPPSVASPAPVAAPAPAAPPARPTGAAGAPAVRWAADRIGGRPDLPAAPAGGLAPGYFFDYAPIEVGVPGTKAKKV